MSTTTFGHRCRSRSRRHQVATTTTGSRQDRGRNAAGAAISGGATIDIDNDRNDLIGLGGAITIITTTDAAAVAAAAVATAATTVDDNTSASGNAAGGTRGRGDGRTVGGGWRGSYAKVIGNDGIVLGGRGRRGR